MKLVLLRDETSFVEKSSFCHKNKNVEYNKIHSPCVLIKTKEVASFSSVFYPYIEKKKDI